MVAVALMCAVGLTTAIIASMLQTTAQTVALQTRATMSALITIIKRATTTRQTYKSAKYEP